MNDAAIRWGMDASALEMIPRRLQAVVDAGEMAGFVTLVWHRGEIRRLSAVGWRDVEARAPMSTDAIFRIASMTKPITSALALMFMEEGRLALDEPIGRWAPELAGPAVLVRPDAELNEVAPARRAITFEDLLTHRAGLAYDFSAPPALAAAYRARLPARGADVSPDAWMAALGELPLLLQPGEAFHYSVATDVLGIILSRMAGQPLPDLMRERLLAPLGMHDTDFCCPIEKQSRLAQVYRPTFPEPGLERVDLPIWPQPPAFAHGGGGLLSTAEDYLRFARMLLNRGELDGRRYLRPETVDLITTNRLTPAQRERPFFAIPMWRRNGFGLGVSMIIDPSELPHLGDGCAGAFGWPGAYETWWQADPQAELILIYLVQQAQPLDPQAAAALATGQRDSAKALPEFQKAAYAALRR